MSLLFRSSMAKGVAMAPPSKSMAHRHIICAALSDGVSTIENIDLSEDIKATLACIGELGCSSSITGNRIAIKGGKAKEEALFRCNESGSTLRFFIPISLVLCKGSRFEGSDVLMTRPLSVYEDICREQGIVFRRENGGIALEGKLHADSFKVPGNISSQFITGLLFALPLLQDDSTIEMTQSVESRPYIDMTIQVLSEFGVRVSWISDRVLSIPGGQSYGPCISTVEGDCSNAAFLDAFNTIGGSVQIKGLSKDSLQGDKVYTELFPQLGKGFSEMDISDCPDLGPVLMAVAAANHGGRFTGTRRLRIKESDRGAVMCQELSRFGIETVMEENAITVKGGKLDRPSSAVQSHNDHRIAMALSLLLSLTGGTLEGENAVRKSFPGFFECIRALGIDVIGG